MGALYLSMATMRQLARARNYDTVHWQKAYDRTQVEYIRKRLTALRMVVKEGMTMGQAASKIGVQILTLSQWLKLFVEGGLEGICQPIRHPGKPRSLDGSQMAELRRTVLEDSPQKWGFDRNIWTGQLLSEMLLRRWGVGLKDSRIYELLKELGITHQRAHRDYANADPQKQKAFVEDFKKNS